MNSGSAIELRDLCVAYNENADFVLNNVSLGIPHGEFVVLLGPSGSGKSTVALCLNGIIPHALGERYTGTVRVGQSITAESPVAQLATQVGLVLQDPESQIATLCVEDEIVFGLENLVMDRVSIKTKLDDILTFMDLVPYRDHFISQLSGGLKQRVVIASALAMAPSILVLDEPTSNLDPVTAREVLAAINRLHKQRGITVVMIEHNVDYVADQASRLIVLSDGQVVHDGNPREILRNHGAELSQDLGVWIPQVSEMALHLLDLGVELPFFPLNLSEMTQLLEKCPLAFLPPTESASTGAHPQEVVRLEDVWFRYRPDGPWVLQGVDLTLGVGEIVGLIGPNGAGKTTLASLIVGLHKPVKGTVKVDSLDTHHASLRDITEKVGYVFQYPEHQFLTDTVYDEMAFGLRNRGLSETEIETRVYALLERLGIGHLTDRHPYALSMGQKRRLSVACMFVMKPKVLILDEPTFAQDRKNLNVLMDLLQEVHQAGISILLITHDMRLVAEFAHRAIVMKDGQVLSAEEPLAVFENSALLQEASLAPPDIYQVSRQLHVQTEGKFPRLSSLREFKERVRVR